MTHPNLIFQASQPRTLALHVLCAAKHAGVSLIFTAKPARQSESAINWSARALVWTV